MELLPVKGIFLKWIKLLIVLGSLSPILVAVSGYSWNSMIATEGSKGTADDVGFISILIDEFHQIIMLT